MENTAATEKDNAWSGALQPGFRSETHAYVINPFIKLGGLELFGNFEQARGRAANEPANRVWTQNVYEATYRFAGEQLFVAGRYNTANGELLGITNDVNIKRSEFGGGWFITPNLLLKGEYVNQKYNDFPRDGHPPRRQVQRLHDGGCGRLLTRRHHGTRAPRVRESGRRWELDELPPPCCVIQGLAPPSALSHHRLAPLRPPPLRVHPMRRPPAVRVALLSLGYLGASLLLAFPISSSLATTVVRLGFRLAPPVLLAVTFLCALAGGLIWARHVAALLRLPSPRRAALGGGIAFGVAAPLAVYALTRAEARLLAHAQAGHAVAMHLAFDLVFPAATLAVIFVAGLGLSLGAQLAPPVAIRVALRAAAAGGFTFLAVALAMDLAGWSVGGPGAEARFTMVTVLALGLVAGALAGGAELARALAAALAPPAPRPRPAVRTPALSG